MFFKESLIFPSINGSHYRIPNVIATKHGTFIAVCNDRKGGSSDDSQVQLLTLCRKEKDSDWEDVRVIDGKPGWICFFGSIIYDEKRDCITVFAQWDADRPGEFNDLSDEEKAKIQASVEEKAKTDGIILGQVKFESFDDGLTWVESAEKFITTMQEHTDGKMYEITPYTHGCGHGITLKNSKYKGRLIAPARTQIGVYHTIPELKEHCYNCAVYSDDNGKTWQTTGCVQIGTGEGVLIENADGSLTYNSRAYFKDCVRHIATSTDGGETWHSFRTDDFLVEDLAPGPYGCGGCNAALIRVDLDDIEDKSSLPNGAEGVTVFTNPHSRDRENMAACISFDGGIIWDKVKVFYPGFAAYSSIDFNPITQTFCLIYEHGKKDPYSDGIMAAEFDLEWLLS